MPEYPVQGDPTPFNHCIYAHRNRINGKVYIGQATGNPKDRWGSNGVNYKKQPYFWQAIQEYGWSNFDHIILMENLSQEDANTYERYWISQYRSNTEAGGYNKTSGGQGLRDIDHVTRQKIKDSLNKYWNSEEGKAQAIKHSKAMKGTGNPMYGKAHTQEAKQAISEKHMGEKNPNFGKHFSKEHRDKISQSLSNGKAYWTGKTGLNNKSSKPVYCLELERCFESAKDAGDILNIDKSSIGKCCRGVRKTAGNYHWRLATFDEIEILRREKYGTTY